MESYFIKSLKKSEIQSFVDFAKEIGASARVFESDKFEYNFVVFVYISDEELESILNE